MDTEHQKLYYLAAKSAAAVWVRVAKASELDLVDEAAAAQKLKTARNIALSGDITGSENFDGSQAITIVTALKNSGVTAGTYTKLTINAKGIVTSAANIAASDVPALTLSKISDAKSAAGKDVGTAAGNVPVLDANGHLPTSVFPPMALTETFVISSEAAMLALSAHAGDIAVRTDTVKTFILRANPATSLENWQELLNPPSAVLSVNGKTGAITLTTSDIAEGSNKYYTEDRATASFNTNFAAKAVTGLSDGAEVIKTTDTIILNGGNA
jgi:hypothetical protein